MGTVVMATPEPVPSLLDRYSIWYSGYHGYVSLVVCAVGIIGNVLNVVVLTRSQMSSSATNIILTALALSDMLTMTSYVPFAVQFYCRRSALNNSWGPSASLESGNSAPWIVYLMFHANFTVTTHTTSIWLGVLLAIFRYHQVKPSSSLSVGIRPNVGGRRRPTQTRVKVAVGLVYVMSSFLMIPNYLSLAVKKTDVGSAISPTENVTESHTYDLISADEVTVNSSDLTWSILPLGVASIVVTINFWTHAIFVKLVPCLLMLLFGCLLVSTARNSQHRAVRLQRQSITDYQQSKQRRRLAERNRTTWMLVTVVILFLITELPQGLLAMCSGLVHGCFESYYLPLGDTMDVVALFNNAINFALYCTMSSRFRLTFTRLLQRSNANPLNVRNAGSVTLHASRRFVSRASVSICEPNQFYVVNN